MSLTPYSRRELFLAALSDNTITLPTPLNMEELYLSKIAGESVTIPTAPLNRYQTYLAKMCGEDVEVPTPASRLETYWYKACGYDVEVPKPASREESLWYRYVGADATADPDTGEVVIQDGTADTVLRKCDVTFTLTQTGTGTPTPENIRPVSGWEGVTISVSGADTSDPTEYPVTWASEGGISAGVLNALTGVLTATHRYLSLDGTEEWTATNSGSERAYFFKVLDAASTATVVQDGGICSHLTDVPTISSSNTTPGIRVFFSSSAHQNRLIVRPGIENVYTAAAFKEWLASQAAADTPLQVAYKLLSPLTVQLTPAQVKTLEGENHIWTDAGTLSIRYTPNV